MILKLVFAIRRNPVLGTKHQEVPRIIEIKKNGLVNNSWSFVPETELPLLRLTLTNIYHYHCYSLIEAG